MIKPEPKAVRGNPRGPPGWPNGWPKNLRQNSLSGSFPPNGLPKGFVGGCGCPNDWGEDWVRLTAWVVEILTTTGSSFFANSTKSGKYCSRDGELFCWLSTR